MKKEVIIFLLMFFCSAAVACSQREGVPGETKEPESLVIETQNFTETKEFQDAVSKAVSEKLSGDVTVTVYDEGVEAFCYYGAVESVDGGGGLTLIIHATGRTDEGDWF